MEDWCLLANLVFACDINAVGVSVPGQFDGSEGRSETKIHAANSGKMAGNIEVLAGNEFFRNGVDSAAA
jgi:hypothetical protein